jgi:hypothetical protein
VEKIANSMISADRSTGYGDLQYGNSFWLHLVVFLHRPLMTQIQESIVEAPRPEPPRYKKWGSG